jgi:hypothetical protein
MIFPPAQTIDLRNENKTSPVARAITRRAMIQDWFGLIWVKTHHEHQCPLPFDLFTYMLVHHLTIPMIDHCGALFPLFFSLIGE